jgi:hypothetical protein
MQCLIADPTGACAILVFSSSGVTVYSGEKDPTIVAVGDTPCVTASARLKKFQGFGGSTPLTALSSEDRGFHSVVTATQLKQYAPGADKTLVQRGLEVAVVGTAAATKNAFVCDFAKLRITYHSANAPELKWFDLAAFDYAAGAPAKYVVIHDRKLSGDVAAAFKPFSPEANAALIQEFLGVKSKLSKGLHFTLSEEDLKGITLHGANPAEPPPPPAAAGADAGKVPPPAKPGPGKAPPPAKP